MSEKERKERQTEIIVEKLQKLSEVVELLNKYTAELIGEPDCTGEDGPTPAGQLGRIEYYIDDITGVAVSALQKMERI